MFKKSFVLALGIGIALAATTVRAENLFEVYQAAVKNDPVTREADARRLAALEAKPQARGLLLPQVNVTGDYAYQENNANSTFTQKDPTTGVVVNVPNEQKTTSDYWTYTARITQTLFRWDQWQALKRADSQVALAEATYRAAEQDLLVRVAQRYFDVLAAEDTLTAAQATAEALSRQLEQAEKRFEVGLIAITDVQEARAAHDSATAAVIDAKRTLASANEALREVTGDTYSTLAKPADDMPLDQPQPTDEDGWVTKARDQNLSVIAARLGVEIANRDVKVAEAGHMPSIDLFAQQDKFNSNATTTNNGLKGPSDADQKQDTIGVQVTIPIFSGGATQSRVREQVYLRRAASEKLDGTLRTAERQTRDAYLGVIAERARVKALQQSVKSNQTALEATEAGFEVGTRTTVDVLLARQRLFEAQRDYARSRYDYLINVVTLKSSAGVLAPGDLQSLNNVLTQPASIPEVRPQG